MTSMMRTIAGVLESREDLYERDLMSRLKAGAKNTDSPVSFEDGANIGAEQVLELVAKAFKQQIVSASSDDDEKLLKDTVNKIASGIQHDKGFSQLGINAKDFAKYATK